MSAPESVEQAEARYTAASHAMQSGVAQSMEIDPASTTPKHLRVGVNSAHVSDSALVELLIDKGIFTREEFYTALADAMENEVASYEGELSMHYGTQVRLV